MAAAVAAAHNTLDTSQAATDVNQAVEEIVRAATIEPSGTGPSSGRQFLSSR